MKGTKAVPGCNFGKHVCAVLHLYGVPFKDVNVSLGTYQKHSGPVRANPEEFVGEGIC